MTMKPRTMYLFGQPRILLLAACLFSPLVRAGETTAPTNLLLNSDFAFHAFQDHRHGEPESFRSHNVAFWNTEAWGDITVVRQSHVDAKIRPKFWSKNLVSLRPGSRFWQFFTLPEAGLVHGQSVSLNVFGFQDAPGALVARVVVMKVDSQDGTWSPADFGLSDKRTFARHGRGELVAAKTYEARSSEMGRVELTIEGAEIIGHFREGQDSRGDDINTVGLRIEFENIGQKGDAWVCAPCLVAGPQAVAHAPSVRESVPFYRHIPRTTQKLWKGESIHIVVMGSSIDRGSANPPLYLYDEDPDSETFKQPLSDRAFESQKIDRPDLEPYFGWWQHYFSYTGRLKVELMRKYDLSADKICLNIMACDGSCVGEAHSGLAEYLSLALPPSDNANGHKADKTWQELYPDLFARPEGPRPDLVIFGSGANEKTDSPDEVAVFEGMIRWIQRHYQGTEFLFCMWQNRGGYTPNPGDVKALTLRYQIPLIDFGRVQDDVTAYCNPYALCPDGGHPDAAGHYLWFKQLERAFECWDPIRAGQAQLHLPDRVHANSYGWEGDITTYNADNDRIRGGLFLLDDTAMNCWGVVPSDERDAGIFVDGEEMSFRRSSPHRDVRNSLFRHGRCRLGDRHVLELAGQGAKLTSVDAKTCPDRRWLGVENPRWQLDGAKVGPFASSFGNPYGENHIVLSPGKVITIDAVLTDVSVAYADRSDGGILRVLVDNQPRLNQETNIPYADQAGKQHYMENRRGILGLPYGLHTVRLEAIDHPVTVLGIFAYDSRSNRRHERRLMGYATAGETLAFSAPFAARPVVICHDDLRAKPKDITPSQVTFSDEATAMVVDNMGTNFFIASYSLGLWTEMEEVRYSQNKPSNLPKVPLASMDFSLQQRHDLVRSPAFRRFRSTKHGRKPPKGETTNGPSTHLCVGSVDLASTQAIPHQNH
ncbi:MAG: SGNH/GDSL hydrolase family protein [Planctomycetes bacterium]|nr:SGNH/GDSL hydrolase family protein [Planctomycetota bacterium]MBL7043542.1 SGNH/GDSL hydrolase family protein [Pirellulaceae bacterium]